ncbi:uncharacterized protein METZ01_LOCUS251390 [marine metagenome]|uniref:Uncharacterized protein n=1 Tax=marine metagenome TaxID=408172 RepID=A0A382IG02_9ZZZZ
MTHNITVPTASPPGNRRVHKWIASNNRSAIPDRSNKEPININSGTAAKTYADETLPIT